MKTYQVNVKNKQGEYELEGIFTSLNEIADYLDAPKKVVLAIFNCEYHKIASIYNNITIDRVYSVADYLADRAEDVDDDQEPLYA